MKIAVGEERNLHFEEVYNSITFKSSNGTILAVCMRDGGFEIGISEPSVKPADLKLKWFTGNDGTIVEMPKYDELKNVSVSGEVK